jgi:hypothetical protein
MGQTANHPSDATKPKAKTVYVTTHWRRPPGPRRKDS